MVKKNEDCDKQETKIKEHFIVGMWKDQRLPINFKIFATLFFIVISIPIVLFFITIVLLFLEIFEIIFKLIFKKK
jgi:hypothetical protein